MNSRQHSPLTGRTSSLVWREFLPATGIVSIDGQSVRFTRPGLLEEYTTSMDGVRQDFVVMERPPGLGELVLRLAVSTVEEPVEFGLPVLALEHRAGALAISWPVSAETGLWRSVNLLEWTPVDGAVADNGVARVTPALADLAGFHGKQFFRFQRSE